MSYLLKNKWLILVCILVVAFIGSCVHDDYKKHMAKKYAEESKNLFDRKDYKGALVAAYKIRDNYIDNTEVREYIKQIERTTILDTGQGQGEVLIAEAKGIKSIIGNVEDQSTKYNSADRKALLFKKAKKLFKEKKYKPAIVVLRQLQDEYSDPKTHKDVESIITRINSKISDLKPLSKYIANPIPVSIKTDNYELAKDLYERCLSLRHNLSQRDKIDRLVRDAKEIRIGEYAYIAYAAGYIRQLSIEQLSQGHISSGAATSAKKEYDRLMKKAKKTLDQSKPSNTQN